MQNKDPDNIHWDVIVKDIALVAAVYLLLEIFGITCPIKWITGISCGGCGMSRAWLSVLRGDFAAAFAFHPLWPVPPAALAMIIFRKKIPQRLFWGTMAVFLVAFVVCYFIRLADPTDTVVTADWKQSLIYKCWKGAENVLSKLW